MKGADTHGPVRTTRDPRRADEWGLVLTARGIPFELDAADGEIRVWTLPEDLDRAGRELTAFEEENRPEPPKPAVPYWGATRAGAVAAWLLIASYGATSGTPSLLTRGSARAERVLGGEPWRAVTALTLHADLPHVLGNAAAAGVLITAASWRVGPGVAVAVSLFAGFAGNLLTAFVYEARHDAIGASTAVFGTLGLLTALALHDARRYRVRRRAPWVLVGASLALLGFLGSNEGSDVLAHAAGWAFGGAAGLGAVLASPAPLRARSQFALLGACAAVVAGAWSLAG